MTSVAFLLILLSCSSIAGCGRLRSIGHTQKPPLEAFVQGEYRPFLTPKTVLTPPPSASADWRVMAMQVEPRQAKNPQWKKIPITSAGELEMPPGSSFHCIYNPVKYRAAGDDSMKGVEAWELIRYVYCSSDGWQTRSSAGLRVVVDAQGQLLSKSGDQAQLDLDERISGRPTHHSILLRPD